MANAFSSSPANRASVRVLFVAATFLVGCGTNNAGVPPALLEAVKMEGTSSNYPAGPYGTEVGDTVTNLCFQGWNDPSADGYDPSKLQKICLGDFHDDATATLLLVESCAIWCVACRAEYGGSADRPSLSDALASRQAQGFRIMGTIFQNGNGSPAAPADAEAWAKNYALTFPFSVDSEHELGLFTSPNVAPFNLLIDTKKMSVVLALDGDEPAVLFGKVDSFLAGLKK